MHAFDAPVAARAVGKAVDIEGRGGDVEAVILSAVVLEFGLVDDLEDGFDVIEPGLAWIGFIGLDPVDGLGGGEDAGFDPAMALFDRGFPNDLAVRGGAKVVLDLSFQGQLVALQGEQEIGLVGDDFVGDLDLAAHGIDGDQRSVELPGLGEMIEQFRDGGDFVGLFRHAELRQGEPPRVRYVEVGPVTLARRLNRRLGKWVARLDARLGDGRGVPIRIPISRVTLDAPSLGLDVAAESTPIMALERWLRRKIVCRIPWS